MRRDYHPYLGHNHLTRSPGNHCMNCGKRMSVPPHGDWNYACWQPCHGKRIVLGYSHDYNCIDRQEEQTVWEY